MNWKRGIRRIVWVVSSLVASCVFILGFEYPPDDIEIYLWPAVAFGLVWLLYVLILFIYRGFQDNNPSNKGNVPKNPFWQWVTGRFMPENDPYLKKEKQKEGR